MVGERHWLGQEGRASMKALQTERSTMRPCVPADLLDHGLQWAAPGICLAQRQEEKSFEIGLSQWQLTGGLYSNRAITLR